MRYLDFIIKKEHFLCNIFHPDILKNSGINQISKCYVNFLKMLDCKFFKNAKFKKNAMDSNIQNLDHECREEFVKVHLNDEYENFEDLYEEINKVQIKKQFLKKIIAFTYLKIMNMSKNWQATNFL